MNQSNLNNPDWSALPKPEDDGAASHLLDLVWPSLELPATHGKNVDVSHLGGTTLVFAYPMTGRPDRDLPDNWDMIPGARGCTPQACSFRDMNSELIQAGANAVFGLSVQDTDYQTEAVKRLHLPFPLLSDASGDLREALDLPVMKVEGSELLKRLTMVVREGTIVKTFYPVFPPDENAKMILAWLQENPS